MPVEPGSGDLRDREPPRIVPAATVDREYDSDDPVTTRRFVYRVVMAVPAGLGSGADHIALPSAELFVDVSHDRLRARFAGPGWPVPAGSEVRLRRDRPGVYVFDDEGGRPLPPAMMAEWFEGGRVTRRGPPLRAVPPYVPRRRGSEPEEEEDVPGELVCAFLAEWSGEPYENVMRRCERGAPFTFRIGFWRAEQTAGVPVELPARSLRADEQGAPPAVSAHTSRAFLEPAALARLTPHGESEDEPSPDAPPEGLAVWNESPTRAVITVDGVTIGWVDAGARALFVGLVPGVHEVGAIRPLGGMSAPGRAMRIPGLLRLCDPRCPRRPPPAP